MTLAKILIKKLKINFISLNMMEEIHQEEEDLKELRL